MNVIISYSFKEFANQQVGGGGGGLHECFRISLYIDLSSEKAKKKKKDNIFSGRPSH